MAENPKEKARSLVRKYHTVLNDTTDVLKIRQTKIAKACALIACDEIIESNTNVTGHTMNLDYWQEVKQEIQSI
jgi:hypothetical protein